MTLTRRRFLTTAAAGSATALIAGPDLLAAPAARAAGPAGDIVGKITVGYQGWFACAGDGAPINGWWHWSQNWSQTPSPSQQRHQGVAGHARVHAHLPDRVRQPRQRPARDALLVLRPADRRHATSCGCSRTAATPRPCSASTRTAPRARPATRWRPRSAVAAETHGRKFYIMYDVTGWTNMQSEIKTDWTAKMSALHRLFRVRQPERQAGGVHLGLRLQRRQPPVARRRLPGRHQLVQEPGLLRDRRGAARVAHRHRRLAGRLPRRLPRVQHALAVDGRRDRQRRPTPTTPTPTSPSPDLADCNANGIDYQPCVLPGDVSGRQRVHGDFMWRQFYNMVRAGAQGIYISMFDEYGEGNQIAKTAETQAMVADRLRPAGAGRGRHRLLVGLLPAAHRRRRPDAQGPDRPDRHPADAAGGATPAAADRGTWRPGKATSASGSSQSFVPGNAVDGDPNTYWESANGAFPQWFQVDLGSATSVGSVVMKLPASWGARTQTLTLAGS